MSAKAIFAFGAGRTAKFGEVLAGSVIVLAVLEVVTGVVGGALLIAHERQTCIGGGNLYVLRCATSNPYVLLGASVIVGTIAQGFLLVMAGAYIHKRGNVLRDSGRSDEID